MNTVTTREKPSVQARQLSAGTFGTLLRDDYFAYLRAMQNGRQLGRSAFGINPLQSETYYVIDRVRYAFMRYCEAREGRENWDCWQDAWNRWKFDLCSVKWVLGYMGATEFTGPFFQGRVEVKHRASDYEASIYNGPREDFDKRVVAKVGCVYPYSNPSDEKPGEELGVLFPLYAPMYFDKADSFIPKVYSGWQKPDVVRERDSYVVFHRTERFEPCVDTWQEWKADAMKAG